MIREIFHRPLQLSYRLQKSEEYFPASDQQAFILIYDATFFKYLNYFQRITNKQPSYYADYITYKNFAYIDEHTHKLYLNLESLSGFLADKINFVGVIEEERNQQQAAVISISEGPFIILNGISYFLLKTNSLKLDFLRILYLLTNSLYVQSKFISQIELHITKAVNIQGAWDIINYLYVISQPQDTFSEFRTTAETKQLVYRQSKDVVFEKQLVVSEKLDAYFTQIFVINFRHKVGFQIDSIRQNLKSELSRQNQSQNYSNYYFTYDGIMDGFTKLLATKKPLLIKQFHNININRICQELGNQVLQNYNIFSEAAFNNNEVEQNNKKQLQSKLKSMHKEVLRPFQEAKKNSWLLNNEIFASKFSDVQKYIKDSQQQIISIQTLKVQKKAIKIFDQEIIMDKSKIFGNKKYDSLEIEFTKYKQRVKSQIFDLFTMISRKQWSQQGKKIKNNQQLLNNLQTRLEINNNKKLGLTSAIKLAEKEQKSLNQLSLGINPHHLKSEKVLG